MQVKFCGAALFQLKLRQRQRLYHCSTLSFIIIDKFEACQSHVAFMSLSSYGNLSMAELNSYYKCINCLRKSNRSLVLKGTFHKNRMKNKSRLTFMSSTSTLFVVRKI